MMLVMTIRLGAQLRGPLLSFGGLVGLTSTHQLKLVGLVRRKLS